MKQRKVETHKQRAAAAEAILNLPDRPYWITVSDQPIRTEGQNSRHWAMLTEWLEIINQEIETLVDTGHTNSEIRRICAENLVEMGSPIEYAAILMARKPEVAHEILKSIVGIPTSTRLGTKEFSKFDDQLDATMAEILGEVRAFCSRN